ncbi:MAG: hypothetical protein AB1757_21745 [Acidobacteriota bacterium]
MLEIILLIVLTRKIGEICESKGRKATGYKILTVVLWFGGEIVGAIIGAILAGGEGVMVYVMALIGAAIGASIAFLLAKNAAAIASPDVPPYG